jgi:hypothetical protein
MLELALADIAISAVVLCEIDFTHGIMMSIQAMNIMRNGGNLRQQ